MDINKPSNRQKQQFVTVVRQIRKGGALMYKEFEKFDAQVNKKLAEGYVLAGNLVIDHCSESCMDVCQPMILATKE